MDLYTYKVGYGSYEDSEYWELKHEKKFTEKQFNKIIEECLVKVLIKIGKPKERWSHRREPSFATLLTERSQRVNKKTKKKQYLPIFLYEMEKHGFEIMEFEQSWNIFGWPSAIKPGDWKESNEDGRDRYNLARRLRRNLFAAKPKYKDHLKIGKAKERKERDRSIKAYDKRKKKEKREEEKNRKEAEKKKSK